MPFEEIIVHLDTPVIQVVSKEEDNSSNKLDFDSDLEKSMAIDLPESRNSITPKETKSKNPEKSAKSKSGVSLNEKSNSKLFRQPQSTKNTKSHDNNCDDDDDTDNEADVDDDNDDEILGNDEDDEIRGNDTDDVIGDTKNKDNCADNNKDDSKTMKVKKQEKREKKSPKKILVKPQKEPIEIAKKSSPNVKNPKLDKISVPIHRDPIDHYGFYSAISCILCPLFGIFAIYYSKESKSYFRRRNFSDSLSAALKAKSFVYASFIGAFIMIVLILTIVVGVLIFLKLSGVF